MPDLTALVQIRKTKDARELQHYILRRRLAISDLERRIEQSRSTDMAAFLRRKIEQENNAIALAARYLPFEQALGVFSGR